MTNLDTNKPPLKPAPQQQQKEEKLPEYVAHAIANIFPKMSAEEFKGLRDDIKERGLQEPIVLYQGKILDGRNRYQACKELGIAPATKLYTRDDPVGFVLGTNLHRRHLNETQRSMIAARLVTTRLGDNQHIKKEGRSIDLATAADMLNISLQSVKRAKAVCQDGAPELVALVDSGEVAVSAAEKLVGKSVEEQTEIAAGGVDAVYAACVEEDQKEKERKEKEKAKKMKSTQQQLPAKSSTPDGGVMPDADGGKYNYDDFTVDLYNRAADEVFPILKDWWDVEQLKKLHTLIGEHLATLSAAPQPAAGAATSTEPPAAATKPT